MDRREFLRTTGAAAAATATAAGAAAQHNGSDPEVAAPSVAAGVHELRLAMPWTDGVAGFPDQGRRLSQRIATLSEGRYRIDFVAGNGFSAVRAGEADLYFGSEHDHLDSHRALSYFAGLPGDRGVPPRRLAAWMLVGGGQALWDDLAGQFGIKAMLAGHSGESRFLATRHIGRMGELAGQKVSVTGLARDVVRGFGLEPVTVDAADLALAMARGDILAAEWGGAIASHSLGLAAVAPYAVGASVNRHGSALSLGMRRSLWDGLTASDRTMFETAAAAELQLALAEEETHRRLLLPEPHARATWLLARELERGIRRVADAVVAQLAASDAHAQRINAGYVAFRRLVEGNEPQPPDREAV
jgi:TRAP-type mannitol/chloroaromatic compound transport system substrate-binding protein